MDPAAAFLDAFGRRLRRRRLAVGLGGARRGGRRALAAALALLVLLALGVLPPPGGAVVTAGLFLAFLAAGTAWGVHGALRREGDAGRFARDIDAAIRGEDLVPAAAALAERREPRGRFGTALLERAAAEVSGLPLDPVGPLPRPPWTLLGIALLVAFLIGLLPKGGFGILPGFGSGWGAGGRPEVEGMHFGTPAAKREGKPKEVPEGKEENLSLELSPLARTTPAGAPVTVGAKVARGRPDLQVFVAVDGAPFVPEGSKGREAWAFDLRRLPGLDGALGPGTHRVTGELRDASDAVVARAAEFEVVVEGAPPSGGAGPQPKGEPPPPPGSRFEEKIVRPLFGEGAEVEKRGRILVLDPEGSRGETPREVGPEEAVREVRARAEDAARREGIDPRDAEAVRIYFEALRRRLEEKR